MHNENNALKAIRRIVGKWLVDESTEATTVIHNIAAVLIEPTAAVTEVRVEVVDVFDMIEHVLRTEDGERAVDREVERLKGELQRLRSTRCGQAEAWAAVFNTLTECVPGWLEGEGTIVAEAACSTIRKLARNFTVTQHGNPAEPAGVDVRFDQTGRQEVVEQNGNTGEHYAELAELAIEQGSKPIDDDQACQDAYNNRFHKIRRSMPYDAWCALWVNGETPAQLLADGWIPWFGGNCPISNLSEMVQVRLRGGDATGRPGRAGNWDWRADPAMSRSPIIAYRRAS